MKYFPACCCALAVLGTSFLLADDQEVHGIDFPPSTPIPWFTGPLLTPSAYTVKPGHFNVQPYLYFVANTASYNHHWKPESKPNFYTTRLQVQAKAGVANGVDFQLYVQGISHETQGKRSTNVGDMPIAFNFLLLESELSDPWPTLKLSVKGNVPLGKYQHLNPESLKTDATGTGSWLPGLMLVGSKLWKTSGIHFLEMRLAINYQIGTPVHVKGFNTFGGASDTRGVAYPGNIFSVSTALQYNLTKRWGIACDLYYVHHNKSRFSGQSIYDSKRTSSEQISLAPAIQYNWSRGLGITGGVWFSFTGRNSPDFTAGVLALNIYI